MHLTEMAGWVYSHSVMWSLKVPGMLENELRMRYRSLLAGMVW